MSSSASSSRPSASSVVGTVALAVTIAATATVTLQAGGPVAFANAHSGHDHHHGHDDHDHHHDAADGSEKAVGTTGGKTKPIHRCIHNSEAIRKATFGFHKLPTAAEKKKEQQDDSSSTRQKKADLTVVELDRVKSASGREEDDEILTIAVIDTDAEEGQPAEPFVSFKHHQEQSHKRHMQKRGFAPSADNAAALRIVFKTPNLEDNFSYCRAASGTSPDMLGGTASCTAADVFTSSQRDLLKNIVLPRVALIFGSYLKVLPTSTGIIQVPNNACGNQFTIPAADQTSGVAFSDIVVYIGAAPSPEGVIAWASMCALNNQGRPAIARANISPRFLKEDAVDDVVKAVVHEMVHALGFTPSYFNSAAVKTSGLIVSGETRRGGQPVTLFKGPATLAAAKAHFGCDSLTGVELENDGSSTGTANGHLERRLYRDDLMSGIATKVMAISEVSLSILVDSGHYYLNDQVVMTRPPAAPPGTLVGTHTKGFQIPKYMYQAGCGVHESKCNTVEGGSGKYFCFERDSSRQMCSDDRTSIGTCNVGSYLFTLPTWGQYFANEPRVGGMESFNDYCPVVVPSAVRQCNNFKNSVSNDTAQGFYYGSDGRCFETSSNFAQSGVSASASAVGTRCLRSRCDATGTFIEIQIGNSPWRSCPKDGSAGTVSAPDGYTGTVDCPAAASFCTADLLTDLSTSDAATVPTTTPAPTTTTTTTTKATTTPAPTTAAPTTAAPATSASTAKPTTSAATSQQATTTVPPAATTTAVPAATTAGGDGSGASDTTFPTPMPRANKAPTIAAVGGMWGTVLGAASALLFAALA